VKRVKIKLKRRRGATVITMLGIAFLILLFGLFFLELQTLYDYQYAIEVRGQRAVNAVVEYSMDDRLRADGYNLFNKAMADGNYKGFLDNDLNVDASGNCKSSAGNVLYSVSYGTPTYSGRKEVGDSVGYSQMEIDVTVSMPSSIGKFFGHPTFSWTTHFASNNFRTDDDERAGL
jgi:competence protein ComGC